MIIDPEGETPIYQQLADALRARIVSGDLPPGRRLPSELTLMQETGFSRGTVKHAARILVETGWVRTSPGRGHFVVPEDERPG